VLNDDAAAIASASQLSVGLELHRREGRWKVTHLASDHARCADVRAFLSGLTASAVDARAQIQAGKLTTLEAVEEQLQKTTGSAVEAWLRSSISTEHPQAKPPPAAAVAGPRLQEMQSCLGRSLDSPEVRHLIAQLPALPHLQLYGDSAKVSSAEVGLSLEFSFPSRALSRLHFFVGPETEMSPSYRPVRNASAYAGELPLALAPADVRRSVERKLGRPPRSSGGAGGGLGYAAEYPTLGLYVQYVRADARDAKNPLQDIWLSAPTQDDPPVVGPMPAGPRITFRLVAAGKDAGGEGAAEALADPNDPAHARTLLVMRHAILDERGIASVDPITASPTDPTLAIAFEFTPDATEQLQKAAREHAGSSLAVVLDGRVLLAARVNGALSEHVVLTMGAVASDEEKRKVTGRLHAIVNALPDAAASEK
jgi:hypothetical protein